MLKVKIEKGKIFSHLRNKWLISTPEEEVRQAYVCKLVNDYGYILEQMDEELQVNNSQRGQGKSRADIVIWKTKEDKLSKTNAFIVVECKSDNVVIHPEDYYQGNNYASWARARFFITHNNAETKYFEMLEDKLPVDLNEIVNIPRADEVNNKEKIKELVEATKVFTRDEFAKLLFKCHSIIRNNDKLDPSEAFDEISKILFIKIRYERQQGKKVFSLNRFNELKKSYEETASRNSKLFYQNLFNKTKEDFEKDKLFEENEEIKIRENSFEQIVKELERYNLSDTGDDVKGIAFEQFLGKTFRGELGQFFTPRTVVDFMVSIAEPKEGDKICDPCCGSGGFLIKAFDYVREKIEADILNQKEEVKKKYFDEKYQKSNNEQKEKIEAVVETSFKKLNLQLENKTEGSRFYNLSHKSIYGSDANPRMARTSKMNMIMHGDGHGGVYHQDGLINIDSVRENTFNFIITNPPFGANVEKSQTIQKSDVKSAEEEILVGKNILELYSLGRYEDGKIRNNQKTEVLFIERCLNLCKEGGIVAIVIPNSILNNPSDNYVRVYIKNNSNILAIISTPFETFQSAGASIKSSLVFLEKNTQTKKDKYTFFGKAEHVGFDSTGRVAGNDLPLLLEKYQQHKIKEKGTQPKYIWIKQGDLSDNLTSDYYLQSKGEGKFKEERLETFVSYREEIFSPQDFPDEMFKVLSVHFDGTASVREEKLGKDFRYTRQYYARKGDIVLSRIDCSNGAVAIIPDELDKAVVSGEFYVLKADKIDPLYLWFVLRTDAIKEKMIASASGMTRRHRLKREELLNMQIPVPQEKALVEFKKKVEKSRKLEEEAKEAWKEVLGHLLSLFS